MDDNIDNMKNKDGSQQLAAEEFIRHIKLLHKNLNIPESYILNSELCLQREPPELVVTELDYYKRIHKLTPAAFQAWTEMKNAAAEEEVTLHLISAYRSVEYQCNIIEKKIAAGQAITDILKVNAAPGYSEHHTGRALDIGTDGCPALQEEFELTEAFSWLGNNAGKFRFALSYPRNNPFGFIYEPWHWCFQP